MDFTPCHRLASAMDIDRWQQIRALFEELVELEATTRAGRIAALVEQDPGLAAEVCALLAADAASADAPTGVLQKMPGFVDDLVDSDRRREQLLWEGRVLGPWRVLREIGQGGMGTVFLAERADGAFEQQVALKLVRPGWGGDELQVRFRVERQILAELNHPNIARLLDGGVTDEGKPWLALEYVDGATITRWCDEHALSLRQRLQLFLDVCDAVAHAHDRLVVHRDLKPSNILVSQEGRVKLLDFGVAKLLGDGRGLSITQPEQRLLTPEYASPEQIRGDFITTGSDIYALGLLMFELLTGRKPYKVSNLSAQAWERAILEQEPSRPSLRASQPTPDATEPDSLTREQIASLRKLDPEQLRRELSGDLDAIILKALRKDPRDRYAGVRELSQDIRAHLDHRPVSARKGSTRYRLSRFLRRHALAASLAALAILALLIGTSVSLWQAGEARQQRDYALAESSKSAAIRDFMLDVFRRSDPARSAGREITARDLLDEALSRFERMRLGDPGAEADLLQAMAEAYEAVGVDEQSNRLLTRVIGLRERIDGDTAAEADAHILQARAVKGMGDLQASMDALERAESLLTPGEHPGSWARLWMARGITQMTLRKLDESVLNLERGSDGLAAVLGETDDITLSARAVLGWAYDSAERYDDMQRLIAPLLQRLRDDADANPVRLADLLDAQASALSAQGRFDEAVEHVREALQITQQVYGEGHRYAGSRWNNLAFALQNSQRLDEAAEAMRQTLVLTRAHYAPGAHRIGSTVSNLARIEMELGQWASAEEHILEGIAIREKPEDKSDLAYALVTAAGIARGAGDRALAAERLALAQHWNDAMPNKPSRLALRLHLEQAEQDLGDTTRRDCRGSAQAQALHRELPLSKDNITLAWVEFVATACAARAGDATAAAELEQRLQASMDLLGAESVRRKWAVQYVEAARKRG
jgi:eukaryotic-like serine/threonine-protein kinase